MKTLLNIPSALQESREFKYGYHPQAHNLLIFLTIASMDNV